MQRFIMTMKVGEKACMAQVVSYPDDASRLKIAMSLLEIERKMIAEYVSVELEELDDED